MSIHDSTKLCCGPFCAECVTKMEKMDADYAQLLSDVRTLQAEAKRWRDECGTKRIGKWEAICPDEDGRYYEKIPEADATDTSGALTRWRDK